MIRIDKRDFPYRSRSGSAPRLALATLFAAFAVAVPVAAAPQQDMGDMPGMQHQHGTTAKPPAKPPAKPAAKPKRKAKAATPATSNGTNAPQTDASKDAQAPPVSGSQTEQSSGDMGSMPGMQHDHGQPQQPSTAPAQQGDSAQPMDHSTMDHGTMDHSTMDPGTMDHGSMDHGAMGHDMGGMGSMAMPGDDGDGMAHSRMGSGTAWQPTSSPGHMWMWNAGDWMIMAHGNLFLTYNQQGGPRGVGKFESMNWVMFMEQRKVGSGSLMLRQMLSAEPLTTPHGGFPLLFQTGETYRGEPLVDHQHPHDLFMELAAMYSVPIGERASWFIYGGPVGEPALGPVAFMHRASALELPAAPLTHHLMDSTHITAGVVTTGVTVGPFKFEGSVFNGREPDENRLTIDLAPLDSYSFRVSVAPTQRWSMQYSVGRLNEPEALEEGDQLRQTASVSYNRPLDEGNWATTLAWGRNHKQVEDTNQNGYLLESTLNFLKMNYVYTRMELLDRDELFRESQIEEFGLRPDGADEHFHPQYRIGAYTFGGVRDLVQNDRMQLGVGADVTFYSKPAELDRFYGDNPTSFRLFLRLRPGLMHH